MSAPKKSAILAGCGYYGTPDERYGCEIDVKTIEGLLRSTYGFLQENITTLFEPTKDDLEDALNKMCTNAGKGDVLCFYFSGLVKVSDNIPAILCSDSQLIPATFFQSLAYQLPEKTSFTLILESSHSAGFIHPVAPNDKRILFSACQENETAKRVVPDVDNANAFSMFTNAIKIVSNDLDLTHTNERLLKEVNTLMKHYKQQACLRCIDKMKTKIFLDYPN